MGRHAAAAGMQGFEGAGAAMKAALGVGGGMCFAAGRMDACHVRLLDETDKKERHATKRH